MKILKRIGKVLLGALVLGLAGLLVRYFMLGVEVNVDAAKLPPAPEKPVATEFSIVNYNVQARPWFDDSVHKFTRIPKAVNPYDIVSFQEMFKDHGRMFAGLTHPVKVYHATLRHPFKIVGSGLGTVSRFPLVEAVGMNFTTAGDFQNKPASKGVLLTRYLVGGLPLDVYTTHMEAGSDRKPEAMWSRRKQSEEIVAFVKAHSDGKSAVILHGDFNMRHSVPGTEDPEIAAGRVPAKFDDLDRPHLFDALNAALGLTDLKMATAGEFHDGVDHVLFRSGSGAVLTPLSWEHDTPAFYDEDGAPLSDHEPVIGRFRISPAG